MRNSKSIVFVFTIITLCVVAYVCVAGYRRKELPNTDSIRVSTERQDMMVGGAVYDYQDGMLLAAIDMDLDIVTLGNVTPLSDLDKFESYKAAVELLTLNGIEIYITLWGSDSGLCEFPITRVQRDAWVEWAAFVIDYMGDEHRYQVWNEADYRTGNGYGCGPETPEPLIALIRDLRRARPDAHLLTSFAFIKGDSFAVEFSEMGGEHWLNEITIHNFSYWNPQTVWPDHLYSDSWSGVENAIVAARNLFDVPVTITEFNLLCQTGCDDNYYMAQGHYIQHTLFVLEDLAVPVSIAYALRSGWFEANIVGTLAEQPVRDAANGIYTQSVFDVRLPFIRK